MRARRNRSTVTGGEHGLAGERPARRRRHSWPPATRVARAGAELIRARGRVRHVPTLQQLRALALFDGCEPCSYLLDRDVNWLPSADEMPLGLEAQLGRQALSFTCQREPGRRSELVVFPSGHGFDLLGGF
jgi:hypothetical protein